MLTNFTISMEFQWLKPIIDIDKDNDNNDDVKAYQCDPPQSLFLKISLPFLPKSTIIVLVLLGKKFSAYLDGALIILIMIINCKKTAGYNDITGIYCVHLLLVNVLHTSIHFFVHKLNRKNVDNDNNSSDSND